MDLQPVIHNTFVVERNYLVKPERVFAAFADSAQKRRWYARLAGTARLIWPDRAHRSRGPRRWPCR
jgi:uncharacterized protein YndB with AHSA1/START domain